MTGARRVFGILAACGVVFAGFTTAAGAWQTRAFGSDTKPFDNGDLQALAFRDATLPLKGWSALRVTVESLQVALTGLEPDTVESVSAADKVGGSVRLFCPRNPPTPRGPYGWGRRIHLYGDSVRRLPKPRGYVSNGQPCSVHVAAWAQSFYVVDSVTTAEPKRVQLSVLVTTIP